MNLSKPIKYEHLFDYHKHNLVYIGDYTRFADTKAGVVLSLNLLLIGFFSSEISKSGFKGLDFIQYTLFFGFFFLLCAVYVLVFKVLWPRYPNSPQYYMSWGGIANFQHSSAYAKKINSLNYEEFINEMAIQNHSLAQVCLKKYKNLKLGFIFTSIGIVICGLCWIIR